MEVLAALLIAETSMLTNEPKTRSSPPLPRHKTKHQLFSTNKKADLWQIIFPEALTPESWQRHPAQGALRRDPGLTHR